MTNHPTSFDRQIALLTEGVRPRPTISDEPEITPYDRILALCEERRLSQGKACEGAGLNRSTLASAKRNGGRMDPDTVSAFARFFEVSAAHLMGWDEPAAAVPASSSSSSLDTSRILVTLDQLEPDPANPRRSFDQGKLRELADSIRQVGLLQNLTVRQSGRVLADGRPIYLVTAGGRRYRALHLLAGEGSWDADRPVPVFIFDGDDGDQRAIALLENLQREDVKPLEEARAFAELQALDPERWSSKAIADRIGCTARTVQMRLKLLKDLAPDTQAALESGKINLAQAEELVGIPQALQAAAVKKAGDLPTAQAVRTFVRRDLIPADRAIFDLAGCPAIVFQDSHGIQDVVFALSAVRVTKAGQSESALHDALAEALTTARIGFRREHAFGPRCRADLWVDGILIEVKKGRPTSAEVWAQLTRYAEQPAVRGLILVLERSMKLAPAINGKPVAVVSLHANWGIAP